MIGALPVIPSGGCSAVPGLSAVCGGVGSSILGAGAGDVLSAIAGGVAQGASWLISQIGSVMGTTTSIDLSAAWFRGHYEVMVGLAALVVLPLLLVSVVQAVYRQSAAALLRTAFVHLPLALVLGAVAVQLVQLALAATDSLSSAVSSASGSGLASALSNLASTLTAQVAAGDPSVPAFVVLLGALFVSFGALLLWVELLVRAAAVYVATLFLPLALASLVWPAIAQWCRRLVETVAALVLSKFVIVAVLSLAVGALGTSTGTVPSELAGGALLLLAAFAPFALLRLVPMIESGATAHLEGVRHRVALGALSAPRSAVSYALRHATADSLPELTVGTGMASAAGAPGEPGPTGGDADASARGIPAWGGTPGADPTEAASAAGAEHPDPRGTPPLWGAPLALPPSPTGVNGAHVIENDALGPVLRWRPQPTGGDDPSPR